jgi:hypothetical protein
MLTLAPAHTCAAAQMMQQLWSRRCHVTLALPLLLLLLLLGSPRRWRCCSQQQNLSSSSSSRGRC